MPSSSKSSDRSTSGGNRTPNRRFWKPVLYQLSYARILEEPIAMIFDWTAPQIFSHLAACQAVLGQRPG